MKTVNLFLQYPVRNESVVGAQVYSHSGEYSPLVRDFGLPARGVSFQFVRKYRSANCKVIGLMGRGWTFTYTKAMEKVGDDILYHDGLGRIYRFKPIPSKDAYLSPDGLYMRLEAAGDGFSLKQRYGGVLTFERPEMGGRLLSMEDRNGNALRFEYQKNAMQILDPLERRIDIRLDQNRIVSLSYADRAWQYIYNDAECLIEVIQPPTKEIPDGSRTRYVYDEAFRLISITNPNNQVYLQNSYDDYGRISQQKHGNGTFKFEYETIGETDLGFPIYRTQVRLKNDALLDLRHDAFGHAAERALLVSAESLSSEDRIESNGKMVPLITKTIFNRHDEIVRRTGPTGDTIYLTYDEESNDPLNRGNLLEMKRTPAPDADTDQTELITRYSYESKYQEVKLITDARGNTTRFEHDDRGNLAKKSYPAVTVPKIGKKTEGKRTTRHATLSETYKYNEAGQLIEFTNARGARVEYFYHPIADLRGAKSDTNSHSYTQRAGGYLARIIRDTGSKNRRLKSKPTRVTNDYGYDAFGNLTTILDGRGNPTRFEYDAQNHVVKTISRKPFGYQKNFRYDANGNLLEVTTSFDHYQYDPVERTIIRKETTACQRFEYNSLNNPVRRTIAGDGRELTRTLVRDANENIVRSIQPMGNVIEYEYDERGLLIAQRLGAQTRDEAETRHTYTRNGRLRSTVDRGGNTVRYDYDGFNRYKGFANAADTVRKQWLDAMGNVTRLQVVGDRVTMNERGKPIANKASVILESRFQYDELNRPVRMNRAWTDPLTGEPLGKSQWDGEEGVVSTVIEYDNNSLPSKVWQETGNIFNLQYDGVNRPVLVNDETGESVSIEYDENSNPVRIERLGPTINGDENRFRQIFNHEFDELDRLVTRSLNGGPPEIGVYNAFGHLIEYKNQSQVSAKYLHDSFGRLSGLATTAVVPSSVNGTQVEQLLLLRAEWDDNNRLIASVNAANHSTKYAYDALNRLSSIVYADGTTRHFERDGNGNIVRLADPNGNIITNRFDAQNRLIERSIESGPEGSPQIEKFHYDGLDRLVAAITDSATTVRCYDSLSRLLEESQSGRAIKYEYDSAGNRVRLIYPSGQEIRRAYDSLRRVTEVRNGQSQFIAAYRYGSGAQILEQNLGNVLKAAFTYEPDRDWLSSVMYRSIETGEIIEGSRCRYDAVGNCIEAVQLGRARNSGERYFYDSANRLVKVQYAVKNLADPDSPFEEEVLYELSPTGIWQLKTTRDANGQPLEQAEGAVNQREAYLSLGKRHFEYDANGNRIFEENGEDNENVKKRYRYDYANRLVRVESLDVNGLVVQIIEYAYDAFNRQVLKRITKGEETREYVRVWNGSQLLEEWQDGKLTTSFTYGARINEPLKMSLSSEGAPQDYLYLLNGYGSVTGLTDQHGELVEAYRYDVFGKPFLTVHGGQEVNQSILSSKIKTPLLVNANIYDLDVDLTILAPSSYDAGTGQAINGAGNGGFGFGPNGPDGYDPYGSDGPLGPGMPGKPHKGLDLSGLGHGLGGNGGDYDPFRSGGPLGPGMPGHKGPDLSGLPGADGGQRESNSDEFNLYGPGGLLGPGMPGHRGLDLSGLPGADGGQRKGTSDEFNLYGPGGLLGPGTPGHRGLDLSNLGGNGGLGGFGSDLAPGGVADWKDDKDHGRTSQNVGMFVITLGTILAGVGAAEKNPALVLAGVVMAAEGYAIKNEGDKQVDHAEQKGKELEKQQTPAPAPEPKPAEPKPKPAEPKPQGSLYPDPDGGGGGNPTQLPDYDGSGGGNPTTSWDGWNRTYLPDYDGSGGGNPTTIWDENGGGGTPNTVTANVPMTLFNIQFR
jgi:YD repeat-containing protein